MRTGFAALMVALVLPQTATLLHSVPPKVVGHLDASKLKGDPTQLGWSDTGEQMFLQTADRDAVGMVKNTHYFVMSATDARPQSVDAAPEWATAYWGWKSNKTAPGSQTFSIDIKQEVKTSIATSAPMGGSLARGGGGYNPNGGGTSVEDVQMRSQQMQKQQVITLTLHNQVIGEFVNQQFLPGYTFGWAPREVGLIAYATPDGHIAVMDEQGAKQEIADTKDALLPAWSADGSKIAFLQRTGKRKYDLVVVDVKP